MAESPKAESSSGPAPGPKSVHIGGESLVDRILPHVKKILIGVVLIAVILTIVFTFRWMSERKQSRETEKLAEVLDVARRPLASTLSEAPDPKNPAFATPAERAAAVLDAIAKQGTQAGGSAFKAGLLLDAGKLDEAIAEYTKGQAATGIEGVLCREGLGIAYETKAAAEKDPAARQKLLEQSLAAFTAMQPDEAGPRRAYALYHQGRLQLALGKRTEAKAAFEKAKELGAATELPELIERRLAAM